MDGESIVEFIIQYGFAGFVLYMVVKKIDELKIDVKELNNSIRELLYRVCNKQ